MTQGGMRELFGNRTIVFATDFLESSRLALDYAIGFALKYESRLVMVHAIELSQPAREVEALGQQPSSTRMDAEARLEAMAAGVRRLGIGVETRIEEGAPGDVLVKAVQERHADLLVLGTHGVHRGLSHLLLGSNLEELLMTSPCPTLTVGRHVMAGVDVRLRFDEVLCISDFSAEPMSAAPVAVLLGRDFDAPVDVCQMLPEAVEGDARRREELASAYLEGMKRLLPEGDVAGYTPKLTLEGEDMMEQVLARAKEQHAGVIVLGITPETFLGRHLHTSFAYRLLAYATCPILTVRRPQGFLADGFSGQP